MLAPWIGFISLIVLMLALDLGVFHRKDHQISIREALGWSGIWITLGLAFSIFIYFAYEGKLFGLGLGIDPVDAKVNDGLSALGKYLTGYVVEKSLSVDNIFVIAMIFTFFKVPGEYQHKVLFWGILGALILRGVMILVGAQLIEAFHWILYVFAAFLLFTGVKMLLTKEGHADPGNNPLLRFIRRILPVTDDFHGGRFTIRESELNPASATPHPSGKRFLTPLALALIMVESTDVVFAVDSIPAIFAITADPFLVFTSNVFAILGLRSLYFALAGMIRKFRYLKVSLSVILIVVGLKMAFAEVIKDYLGKSFNLVLLGLIVLILAAGIFASIAADRKKAA